MLKNSKGITLVALVVTIIVLIILASVSVSLLLGQNGLLNRTNQAKNDYEAGRENDYRELNNAVNFIDEQLGE